MGFEKLISGTDIRGIVSDFEEKKANLTEKEVKEIAEAFGKWITQKCEKSAKNESRNIRVAVGYDARHTGPLFSEIIRDELKSQGIDVLNCKMSITPSLFMTTIFPSYKSDAAIMITASHLPSYYNGIKFFTKDGGVEKEDLFEMVKFLKKSKKVGKGNETVKNLADDYAKYLCELIRKEANNGEKPLENLKIVIDAGNGAAGFFAEKVINELGGDSKGSQFLNPDGDFPNHVPNPEVPEAINSIKEAVLKSNADFGIIFDADGDRSAFIDKSGREINRNRLIALVSDILLKQKPNGIIVTDSITSTELTKFIESRNGIHHRFKRGYKNVINEAKRLNAEGKYSPLAIETSGHAALINNYFLDDGAYMAALLLIQLVQSKKENIDFTAVLNELGEPAEEKELRIKIEDDNFRELGNKILKDLEEYVKTIKNWEKVEPNYEGVRVNVDKDNWFLIRMSLYEPLFCINIETSEVGKLSKILKEIYKFLGKYKQVKI
ncbi:phosphoglucomutase [Leptotrichia sp. oral taxon 847]|uniref:phosphoglucomutase n=1 Tax=Leptotrichia sp. oral taxon 847 TaxID=1785996 RepID=UPI0007684D8A|nr:phosphoglucomutase [Leptotrichia sp. oral taxon 847]AMD95324.1 phosphoglucomutase [Leptotrichia sp. oral taxon 847]